MKAPWYETAFGPHYADIYGHRDRRDAQQAIAFLTRKSVTPVPPGALALDLCCGEGRHSIELLRVSSGNGLKPALRTVGMDLSPDLLRNAAESAARENMTLPLVRGDMRLLPFRDGTFHLVLNLFTSFGYFEDDEQNESVFHEAARVLKRPSGYLVLDHINPPWLRQNLQPETERVTARGTRVRETRWLDPDRRRVEKRMEFKVGGREHCLRESVRLYENDEVLAMAGRAGLSLVAAYGGFDGSALTEASPRAIHVFRTESGVG
jgi:ubiquinone/menaquinone biosynthesis C-methylase UbiE